MGPIPLILGAASLARTFFPDLEKRILGDRTGAIASEVLDIASSAVGVSVGAGEESAIEKVVEALTGDPAAQLETRASLAELERREHIAELEAAAAQIRETGQTARAELATGDRFVMRARPAAIYAMIVSVVAIVAVVLGVFIFNSTALAELVDVLALLQWPLGALGMVSGVYAWRRSDDKKNGVASAMPGPLKNVL